MLRWNKPIWSDNLVGCSVTWTSSVSQQFIKNMWDETAVIWLMLGWAAEFCYWRNLSLMYWENKTLLLAMQGADN